NGEALQTLHNVDTVALDKTGTLTIGTPALTDLVVAAGFERETVLQLVAAVEMQSEHPIARAIIDAAEAPLPWAEGFHAVPGHGVAANVNGQHVAVGADRFMAQQGCNTAA